MPLYRNEYSLDREMEDAETSDVLPLIQQAREERSEYKELPKYIISEDELIYEDDDDDDDDDADSHLKKAYASILASYDEEFLKEANIWKTIKRKVKQHQDKKDEKSTTFRSEASPDAVISAKKKFINLVIKQLQSLDFESSDGERLDIFIKQSVVALKRYKSNNDGITDAAEDADIDKHLKRLNFFMAKVAELFALRRDTEVTLRKYLRAPSPINKRVVFYDK